MPRLELISFAQNREDVVLKAFFRDLENGFYVDVGANHPVEDSVTKYFYQQGWRGINIEPNKKLYSLIQVDRPGDVNCNVGVGNKDSRLKFREYDNHGLSTFSNEMKKEHESNHTFQTDHFEEYEVKVRLLKDIFADNKVQTINFLKIDIEGFEYEALEGNDWQKYRPEVICIESNHIVNDWRPLLKENAYKFVFFDGLNDYYVASESKRAESFSYVDTFLLENEIIPWSIYKQRATLERQNKLSSYLLSKSNQSGLNRMDAIGIKSQLKNIYFTIDAKIVNSLNGGSDKFNWKVISTDSQDLKKTIINHYLNNQPTFRQDLLLKIYRIFQEIAFKPLRVIKRIRRG